MSDKQDPARWRAADELFTAALDLPESEREEFLAERCAGDPDLLEEVRKLLTAANRSDAFFERSARDTRDPLLASAIAELEAGRQEAGEDLSGTEVGPWRLVRRIARGGHATVYEAVRADGLFAQQVAVKVLRRGLDTGDLLRRFSIERQILSSLSRPGIARLLDGGSLPDGRPYLVMEYVEGLPIDEYCDRNRLDVEGRLRLLVQVARIVHHAHQHLVVHRDLKTSNVFVTADGSVRLLDFGIAKLLDPSAMGLEAPKTRAGHRPLTPEYASPEQLLGLPVTMASDVYQLGLLSYELLTGRRAFDGSGDTGKPADRVRGMPPPPSMAARASGAPRARRLSERLRGDLDVVVLKAMRQEPEARYASALDFARDLESHLAGQPVEARPPTLRYLAAKLIRRQPWLAPVVLLVAALLVAYAVSMQTYAHRLERERDLATRSQDFLVDLLRSADPYAATELPGDRDITVVEALELGMSRVEEEFADQPQLQAVLYDVISRLYANVDRLPMAIQAAELGLALNRRVHGGESAEVAASLRSLGGLHAEAGDFEEAGRLRRSALAMSQRTMKPGDIELAQAQIAMGMQHNLEGDSDEASEWLEMGIQHLRSAAGDADEPLMNALHQLSNARGRMGDNDAAIAALTEALFIAQRLYGSDSVTHAILEASLAAIQNQNGELEASDRGFHRAVPVLRQRLGPTHRVVLTVLNNHAITHSRMGDYATAETLQREVLRGKLERAGDEPRGSLGDTYQNLATVLLRQERVEEALPLLEQAYDMYLLGLHPDHFRIALPMLTRSYAELELGRPADAERSARVANGHLTRVLPEEHFIRAVSDCLLGLALAGNGREDEGRTLINMAWPSIRDNPNVPEPYGALCNPAG